MQKYHSRFLVLGFVALLTGSAFAAPATSRTTVGGASRVYLGLGVDTAFGLNSITVPSLTAIFAGERGALQVYLGLAAISPFEIGAGANYKFSVVGDSVKGFHLGGGVGFGTNSTQVFYVNIAPLMGIHFEIVDRVLFNFDAGLIFRLLTQGTPTAALSVGGTSGLLGMSVLFLL